LIAVFLPAMLAIGCLTVSPDECWPNTSGGLGGSKPIPIGAGVGATSGGDPDGPSGGTPNPCTAAPAPSKSDKGSSEQSMCEVPTPAGEGATSWSCTDECSSKCSPPGTNNFVTFAPSEFPFVTTIQDDGTGKAGGYQVAKVNLEFKRILIRIPPSVRTWYCPFTIGMPLRTEFMGKISASLAASLSVEITEGVARGMDFELPPGIFCEIFVPEVRAAFKSKYPLSGATATK
jgi:hypothetical protein